MIHFNFYRDDADIGVTTILISSGEQSEMLVGKQINTLYFSRDLYGNVVLHYL